MVKYLITALATLLFCQNADARRWSYLYIQGDKQIPFYVKLEGEMMPRYSKNYFIIPELEAGRTQIQILFQQNQYPPQTFNILIPEAGYRGFLLTRKDQSFALYDIQQRFYLMPGNEGEDHLPEMVALSEHAPPPVAKRPHESLMNGPEENKLQTVFKPIKEKPAPKNNEPNFIENLELPNNQSAIRSAPEKNSGVPESKPEADDNAANEKTIEEQQEADDRDYIPEPAGSLNLDAGIAPIINSDCPEPLSETAFDRFYNQLKGKRGGEKKIDFLMKKSDKNCFTTRQVFFLARELSAESMRYNFLKKIYPRITDQQNFYLLEDHLFKTLEWRSYFRLIQNP